MNMTLANGRNPCAIPGVDDAWNRRGRQGDDRIKGERSMGYKKHFELNVQDIELIEDSLGSELKALTRQVIDEPVPSKTGLKPRIDEIRSLLAKLHNQKIWYGGSGEVARIPRG